jgi:FkbM family methyltransferase
MWTVCSEGLGPKSIVYSFGVGDNIAWELALIERFGVTVHAFDPTPACVAWIKEQMLPERFHFYPFGIAGHDGICPFHLPRHGNRFNHIPVSPNVDGSGSNTIEMPVRRLTTIMDALGHRHVDVFKMDIEGGEYAVLDDVLGTGARAHQLLVEFHHHMFGASLDKTIQAIAKLQSAGYQIFHISERGLEFSFINNVA